MKDLLKQLRDIFDRLSKLGNGAMDGNSDGNVIAQHGRNVVDAALAVADQGREEWMKEAERLAQEIANQHLLYHLHADSNIKKANDDLIKHLRAVPAQSGYVIVGYRYRGIRSGLITWSETRHDSKSSPSANFEETTLYAAAQEGKP